MEQVNGKGKVRGLKNLLLICMASGLMGMGYVTYDQNKENDQLRSSFEKQVEDAELSFSTIEKTLSGIRSREGYVLNSDQIETTTGVANPMERIAKEIKTIEAIIASNHEMMKKYSATIGEQDVKLKKFKKSMARLERKLREYKDKTSTLTAEVSDLKNILNIARQQGDSLSRELARKNMEIEQKSTVIATQSGEIDKREKHLRTAFYTVGTYKELKASNVVDKEGSIIGLAGKKTLKPNFDRSKFTKIDIFNTTSIDLPGDAEIITNHDPASYELVKGEKEKVNGIKIVDPAKFWENSKYLVIVTKNSNGLRADATSK